MQHSATLEALKQAYEHQLSLGLNLDLTRGKPSTEQLDMVTSLGLNDADLLIPPTDETGFDCRNYGLLEGIPEARRFFADLLSLDPKAVLVQSNASLTLMYDCFARALLSPLPGETETWLNVGGKPKVLCPAPGYDRHFQLAASLGADLVLIPMEEDGPNLEALALAMQDPCAVAMFVVPVYSNPTGITLSEEKIRAIAALPAPSKFRVFWDNAYCVHTLDPGHFIKSPDILQIAREEGNPERFFVFASSSKMTYANSGLACFASSEANLAWFKQGLMYQSIGPDKLNQLRHIRFIEKVGGIQALMAQHARILKPKFDLVQRKLEAAFSGTDLVRWTEPKGGYFFSLDLKPGQAKRVYAAAKRCGVALTPAGASFPNGFDPQDSNLRLAPSFPSLEQLDQAMDVLCTCIHYCANDLDLVEH